MFLSCFFRRHDKLGPTWYGNIIPPEANRKPEDDDIGGAGVSNAVNIDSTAIGDGLQRAAELSDTLGTVFAWDPDRKKLVELSSCPASLCAYYDTARNVCNAPFFIVLTQTLFFLKKY